MERIESLMKDLNLGEDKIHDVIFKINTMCRYSGETSPRFMLFGNGDGDNH